LANDATGGADGVRRAVLSYVTRMATRPTPFGLFATCAAGTLGPNTTLALAGATDVQRRTRLDFGFLAGVVDALDADRAVRAHVRYRPNTALYRAGGRIRLAERRVDGATVRYHRRAVGEDDALAAALATPSA